MLLATVPQTFFDIIWYLIVNEYPLFINGIKFTLIISILGTLIGLILAFLVTSLRILERSKRDSLGIIVLKIIGNIFGVSYVEFFRGTPMIVQAMIFYYGLAMLGYRL